MPIIDFDARLCLISLLFFAVSVLITLLIANTPLTRNDNLEGIDSAALNDEHGHLLGDGALRLVARKLAECPAHRRGRPLR